MRGLDFQIQFERVIQEMSDVFISEERPDTFTIFKFIGQAQIRYLKEKYINLPTTRENIEFIQRRSDDLKNLIKTVVFASPDNATLGVYAGRAKYIDMIDDYVFYIRSDSEMTRTDAIPIASGQYVPNKIIPHSELDNVLDTPWNYPILRNPVVVFEENKRIYVVHDTYTSAISNISLTYLRRPYNFDTSYAELTTDVSSVGDNIKMRALTAVTYDGTDYSIGDYLIKESGKDTITGTICTPYDAIDETTECEFSYHTHDDILRIAVQMYIEEAKFRLNIKPAKQT
ncbi:MAG: hypothetical protein J7M10_00285 [Candidatus Cloacimonetes bacterium]|nr:hypothetical protein [Candidatus Cloacimonadota bacterium]